MTRSRPNSSPGTTPPANTRGQKPGQTIQTTTSRTDRRDPKGHYRRYTPEELEETKAEMLKVSYADIEREFLQACEESRAPRTRRRLS